MAQMMVQPTASQFASAASHLEKRSGWRTVRIDGERYVSMESGTSSRVYLLRVDARGCSCPWYGRLGRQCSHMLALELAALEDDLTDGFIDAALGPPNKPRASYADVFGVCNARGCDQDRVRGGEQYCDRHLLVDAF